MTTKRTFQPSNLVRKRRHAFPARMATHAELTPDGTHYILNGEKLWCTNGTRAGLIVVMARTPLPDSPMPARRPTTGCWSSWAQPS